MSVVADFRFFVAMLRANKSVRVVAHVGRPASAELLARCRGELHPEVLALAAKADGLSVRWQPKERAGRFSDGIGGAFKLPTLRQFLSQNKAGSGYEDAEFVAQPLDLEAVGDVPSILATSDLHVFDLDGYAQPCTVGSVAAVIHEGIACLFVADWGSLLNASTEPNPEVLERARQNAALLNLPIPRFARGA